MHIGSTEGIDAIDRQNACVTSYRKVKLGRPTGKIMAEVCVVTDDHFLSDAFPRYNTIR